MTQNRLRMTNCLRHYLNSWFNSYLRGTEGYQFQERPIVPTVALHQNNKWNIAWLTHFIPAHRLRSSSHWLTSIFFSKKRQTTTTNKYKCQLHGTAHKVEETGEKIQSLLQKKEKRGTERQSWGDLSVAVAMLAVLSLGMVFSTSYKDTLQKKPLWFDWQSKLWKLQIVFNHIKAVLIFPPKLKM